MKKPKVKAKSVAKVVESAPPKKPKLNGAEEMRAITKAAMAREVDINLKDVLISLRRQAEAGVFAGIDKFDAKIAPEVAIKLREQGFTVTTVIHESDLTVDEEDEIGYIEDNERALRISWEENHA